MKFRKKPIVIEAVQFKGKNVEEIEKFTNGKAMGFPNYIMIKTLKGDISGNKGDWIIKGVNGEFYPIKDYIFTEIYERVTEFNGKEQEENKDSNEAWTMMIKSMREKDIQITDLKKREIELLQKLMKTEENVKGLIHIIAKKLYEEKGLKQSH